MRIEKLGGTRKEVEGERERQKTRRGRGLFDGKLPLQISISGGTEVGCVVVINEYGV